MAAFEERAQCFVDQYSEFTVPGHDGKPLHVNGRLTLGENIADAGGLTAAFHAWKKRDENSPDPVLPGLTTFTKEQLFFVSYANWWCGKSTNAAAEAAIYNDPHAPKRARIIVSQNTGCTLPSPEPHVQSNNWFGRAFREGGLLLLAAANHVVNDREQWQILGNLKKRSIVPVDAPSANYGKHCWVCFLL